jgi:hypothetical protein
LTACLRKFHCIYSPSNFTSYTTGNSRPTKEPQNWGDSRHRIMTLESGTFEPEVPLSAGSPAAADGSRMHQDGAHCNLAHGVANLISLFGDHVGGVLSTYLLALWAAIFNLLYCCLMQEASNVHSWTTLRVCGMTTRGECTPVLSLGSPYVSEGDWRSIRQRLRLFAHFLLYCAPQIHSVCVFTNETEEQAMAYNHI